MGGWNDFFGPLIYLNDANKRTLALGLKAMAGWVVSAGAPRWALAMAMSFVVMLPCLFLFFFAQRYFIQGVVVSGVKG
jgi:multiple sugar transport system permease protein